MRAAGGVAGSGQRYLLFRLGAGQVVDGAPDPEPQGLAHRVAVSRESLGAPPGLDFPTVLPDVAEAEVVAR